MKVKISLSYILSVVLAIGITAVLIQWKNVEDYRFFGIFLIITSVNTVYRCRHTKKLLLLISIIAYINISAAVLDMLLMGELSNDYQDALRHSISGLSYAKAYLLMATVMDLMITEKFVERCAASDTKEVYNPYNPFIATGAMLISLMTTALGFGGGGLGGYTSNHNAFFEYVILFVVIGFAYAGDNKVLRGFLVATGCIYILRGILGGDRSSAFMMVLVLFLALLIKKVKMTNMIGYSIGGIIAANMIGELRNRITSFQELWDTLISRGAYFFFSDTVSASYYAGVTIVEYMNYRSDRTNAFFVYIKELFTGISQRNHITSLASQVNHNGGGGMYPSYFYFFGGFVGVILSTIILMWLIKRIMTRKTVVSELYANVIIALIFRWYLYTATTLYRTVFVNFTIVVLACYVFDKATRKDKTGRLRGKIEINRRNQF